MFSLAYKIMILFNNDKISQIYVFDAEVQSCVQVAAFVNNAIAI